MMTSRIHVLPDLLIDQIAAGEVIENPASAVKELLENSLDAHATKVHVELRGGGFQLIRIEDDGDGMGEEDMMLSLQRHATSKISSLEDLQHLHSMGFRGEALASIVSISKLRMESSLGEKGFFIECEQGKIVKQGVCSRTKGTTIEVRSLFYNVPARKNFQKTIQSSISDVLKVVTKLSLGYPDVSFSFVSQEKEMISSLRKEGVSWEKSLGGRIQDVLGEEFFSSATFISHECFPIKISGYIAAPSSAKKTRSGQYLLINQRSIFSSFISQVVKDAYGTRLGEHFYPAFVLHLEMPASFVDVNVHPQKKEVRLREERFLRDEIQKAILKGFEKTFLKEENPTFSEGVCFFETSNSFEEQRPYVEEKQLQQGSFLEGKEKFFPYRELSLMDPYFLIEELGLFPKMAVVDLQGIEAKLLFDAFSLGFFQASETKIESQTFLFPLILELSMDQVVLVESFLEKFSKAGFEIRVLSTRSIAIDAVPSFLSEEDCQRLFFMLLEEVLVLGKVQGFLEDHVKKVARSICRVVRAKKKKYAIEEARNLLANFFQRKQNFYDPLGNPVMVYITEKHWASFFPNQKESSWSTSIESSTS